MTGPDPDGRTPDGPPAAEGSVSRDGGTGLGALAAGDAPSASALLGAVGGVRGLAETLLPPLAFLVLYPTTRSLPIALGVSVAASVVATVARLVARSRPTLAIAGLVGVAGSAVLALVTHRAVNNFLPGFVIDALYGLVLLVSMIVGRPLLGVILGALLGDGARWRRDARKRRVMQVITGAWVVLFAARLAAQVPFYLAGDVTVLATLRLVMGVPLYASLLLVTWLLARTVYDLSASARGRAEARRREGDGDDERERDGPGSPRE